MKTFTITAFLVLMGLGAHATTSINMNMMDTETTIEDNRRRRPIRTEAVLFTLRNVDFAVDAYGNMNFDIIRGRRGRGLVRYDRWGRVNRIKGMRIHYDARGRVGKIGHIKVRYRRGWMHRIGNLNVRYNRRGRLIVAHGHVNPHAPLEYGHDCNDHNFGVWNDNGHFGHDAHHEDHNDDLFDDGVYFEKNRDTRGDKKNNNRRN